VTVLIGIGPRRGRRAVGAALMMVGVLPSFVMYVWWLVPALLGRALS
jgi:hypothetical protein